jgi:hypothetical protein
MYIEFVILWVLNNQVSTKFRPSCGVFAGMCFDFFHDPRKANYGGLDSLPAHPFITSHTFLGIRRGGYEIYCKRKNGQDDTAKLKETKFVLLSDCHNDFPFKITVYISEFKMFLFCL